MASIGIGALGEPALAHVFEPLLGGALGHAAAVAVFVVISYLLITIAQSIIGEIAPKLYTIQHAEDLARRIARPLHFFRIVFHPLILVLNSASESLLRAIGTDPDAEPEGGTPDELKRIIAESRSGGSLDVGEANMLTGVFHLHEQEARQVMTPIPAVVTVDLSQNVQDALRLCVRTGHSRLVVTEDENQDRVKGIVHVNQLVKLMMSDGYEAHFGRLVRAAPLVPETKPLDDLLADLQRERTELAIVIDEYGRTAGIVTRSKTSSRRSSERSTTRRPGRGRRSPAGQRGLVRPRPCGGHRPRGLRPAPAGRHRRLQLGRRVRVRRARPASEAWRPDLGRRLLDSRRVRAREPDRGGQDPAPQGSGRNGADTGRRSRPLRQRPPRRWRLCAARASAAEPRIIRYIYASATTG